MKVAFLYDLKPAFPPDFNGMKSYYVSEEMTRRGINVTWLSLDSADKKTSRGINLVGLKVPTLRIISAMLASFGVIAYCLSNSIRIVYIDAWFYSRDNPFRQLLTILSLRIAGVRVVVDQRDPYLDFEIARGAVRPGTLRHRLLKACEKVSVYTCSLLILPSKAYENLLVSEGAPPQRVKGIFRGIDLKRFSPLVDGSAVRNQLGLDEKFVVGWFGMMYGFRRVSEVLIPLAQSIDKIVPNSRMIIGGRGPMVDAVREASRAKGGAQFDYVGPVDYSELPSYLSACDLLLCPINNQSRFTRHSNWLKILEGLAVGVPVIATKTESSSVDLGDLKGITWTGERLGDFQASIESVHRDFARIKAEAKEQSSHLDGFGIERTIPVIVDQVLQAGGSLS